MLFIILTLIFAICTVILDKEKLIVSFFLMGLFLGAFFIQLGEMLIGIFQFVLFADISLFLFFYRKIRISSKKGRKLNKVTAIILTILFLIMVFQVSVNRSLRVSITGLWDLRLVDVLLLSIIVITTSVAIVSLKRWKNVC